MKVFILSCIEILALALQIKLGSQLTPVRHDRDKFIRLNEENILPQMKNNFEKRPYGDAGFHTAGSVDPKHTPYDVLSVIICVKRGFLLLKFLFLLFQTFAFWKNLLEIQHILNAFLLVPKELV